MSGAGRIAAAFETCRTQRRAARIPFLVCGDPSPEMTVPLCEAFARAGADVIELGVPFTDPLADGPTIQRAAGRALAHGVTLSQSIAMAAAVRARIGVPLVLFTYVNPILRMGEEAFAERVAGAGVDGVLVTDLPLEEGEGLRALLMDRGVDPILLVAPTSGSARIAAAARAARGFIYCIARMGVTGAREDLPEGLAGEVASIREATSLPVAVGFGISTPHQVKAAGAIAQGVVVGSALVAFIEAAVARGEMGSVVARVEKEASRIFGT